MSTPTPAPAVGRAVAPAKVVRAAAPAGEAVSAPGPADVLLAGIAAEIASLDREIGEVEKLGHQVAQEAARLEQQRERIDAWVTSLERDPRADPAELKDARTQQIAAIRRSALFEAQGSVLEGKARALGRFRDRMRAIAETLGDLLAAAPTGWSAPAPAAPAVDPLELLRAQEDMRRDISRRMHDGPAQTLSSIALQVEVVERLASRGDPRAPGELAALRRLVQSALDTTKAFIFEVRPMVLDDLGLLPSLRRMVMDRGERAGVEVLMDSQGVPLRLHPDLESGLYRLVTDAVGAILGLRPEQLSVRLDWTVDRLVVETLGLWPMADAARGPVTAPQELPPALAAMLAEDPPALATPARAIPAAVLADLTARARVLGASLVPQDGAVGISLVVGIG